MLQKKTDQYSLIVYDSPAPPRFLTVKKTYFKILIILFPLIVITSILVAIYSFVHMKAKMQLKAFGESHLVTELREEINGFKNDMRSKENEIQGLEEKISSGAILSDVDDLKLIQTPVGYKDISNQSLIEVDNIQHQIINNELQLSFDLLTPDNGNKISGYIHIIQLTSRFMAFYPFHTFSKDMTSFKYNNGESFTVTRFRPVQANFALTKNSEKIIYKVLIFNRQGELIYKNNLGPFPVGTPNE
jgi:hypothetical protein